MNPNPIARAIVVASIAIAAAWMVGTFASFYATAQSWFDHLVAFLPAIAAGIFIGVVFQLTMNTPEMQTNRSPKKPAEPL